MNPWGRWAETLTERENEMKQWYLITVVMVAAMLSGCSAKEYQNKTTVVTENEGIAESPIMETGAVGSDAEEADNAEESKDQEARVPEAELLEGLAVSYSGGSGLADDISAWLETNGVGRE